MVKIIDNLILRTIINCLLILFSVIVIELILQIPFVLIIKDIPAYSIYIMIGTIILGEGIVLTDRFLDRIGLLKFNLKKRVVIQLIICILWSIAVSGFIVFLIADKIVTPLDRQILHLTILIGFTLAISFNSSLLIKKFFNSWKQSVIEIEKLKNEKLQLDYKVLQDQLNPHFLFNTLNVLISEIKYNSGNAITYTENLANVYRYVLQSKNHNLISLSDEIEFIESYFFLHKSRLGRGLVTIIKLPEETLSFQIPPLTLQILAENALKHNIATEQKPLTIKIECTPDDSLEVSNNLQPKATTYSTHSGLNNIIGRYSLLSTKPVIIDKGKEFFSVKVPLITY